MSDENATPWWLEPGAETCQFCERPFHYEAGYHCAHCDCPVCPSCVLEVHETREAVCPECIDAAGHKGGE